jgi:hypothetical protein
MGWRAATRDVNPDPWSEETAEPPRWIGQQAGCIVAVAFGVIALTLIAVVAVVVWTVLRHLG